MQEPVMRAGAGVFAIAGAEDPVAPARLILDAKIIAYRRLFGSAFPPFAKNALRPVGAQDAGACAAPGKPYRRMLRQRRHGLDPLRPGEKPGGTRPRATPAAIRFG